MQPRAATAIHTRSRLDRTLAPAKPPAAAATKTVEITMKLAPLRKSPDDAKRHDIQPKVAPTNAPATAIKNGFLVDIVLATGQSIHLAFSRRKLAFGYA